MEVHLQRQPAAVLVRHRLLKDFSMIKYSAQTGGFYMAVIHGDEIPADVVDVTDDEHRELLAGQAHGKRIVPGAGGRPQLAEPTPMAPVVPSSVTMRQARLALLAIGKLGDAAAAIASMPSPDRERALIEWEYATQVERNSPVLLALAPSLGLDLDDLFRKAIAL